MSPFDPEIGERLKSSGAEFLMAGISTALSFVGIARWAHEPETKFRNQRNARKAYDKVQELLARLHLSPEQQSEIDEKLSHLKAELVSLGETLLISSAYRRSVPSKDLRISSLRYVMLLTVRAV